LRGADNNPKRTLRGADNNPKRTFPPHGKGHRPTAAVGKQPRLLESRLVVQPAFLLPKRPAGLQHPAMCNRRVNLSENAALAQCSTG